MDLILFTAGCAIICIPATAWLVRSWVNPCTWYWLGWLIGVLCAQITTDIGLGPPMSSLGVLLITRANIGAAIGFTGAALLERLGASPEPDHKPRPIQIPPLAGWLAAIAVLVEVVLGSLLLLQRIHEFGMSALTAFADVRQSFLEESYLTGNLPPLFRAYEIVACFAAVAPILLAIRDARDRRFRLPILILVFLASAPGGISTGGRTWIATVFSTYLVAFVLAADWRLDLKGVLRPLAKMILAILVLLGAFVAIGSIREAANPSGGIYANLGAKNRLDRPLYPLYGYLGIPVLAAGPYGQFALTERPTHGMMYFPFFAEQLGRLHMAEPDRILSEITDSRAYVFQYDDVRLSTTHSTILTGLVMDFGAPNLILVMAVLTFGFGWLYARVKNRGIVGLTVTTMICLYGCFSAFQDVLFGSSTGMLPIVFAILMTALASVWQGLNRLIEAQNQRVLHEVHG